jgi:predicted FMN-binding regulatory protein PaiB
MIIATLCTTNNSKPWGANVPFELNGTDLITTLATKYTHFQNLQTNAAAVIVYKKDAYELIMKAKASPGIEDGGKVKVTFAVNWLRVAGNGKVEDFDDLVEVARQLKKNL